MRFVPIMVLKWEQNNAKLQLFSNVNFFSIFYKKFYVSMKLYFQMMWNPINLLLISLEFSWKFLCWLFQIWILCHTSWFWNICSRCFLWRSTHVCSWVRCGLEQFMVKWTMDLLICKLKSHHIKVDGFLELTKKCYSFHVLYFVETEIRKRDIGYGSNLFCGYFRMLVYENKQKIDLAWSTYLIQSGISNKCYECGTKPGFLITTMNRRSDLLL